MPTSFQSSLSQERLDVHEAMLRTSYLPTLAGWQLVSLDKIAGKQIKHVDFVLVVRKGERTRTILIECKTDTWNNPELPVEVWANIPERHLSYMPGLYRKPTTQQERLARTDYITKTVRNELRYHYRTSGAACDTASWDRGLALADIPAILAHHGADEHVLSYLKADAEILRWYALDTESMQSCVRSYFEGWQGIIGPNNEKGKRWFSFCVKLAPLPNYRCWVDGCYAVPVESALMRRSSAPMKPFVFAEGAKA